MLLNKDCCANGKNLQFITVFQYKQFCHSCNDLNDGVYMNIFSFLGNYLSHLLDFQVIKNGQILQTKSTSIRSAFAQTTFYVTMTTDMHPESKIIAYFYDQEHKELIADGITFTVDKSIDNEVSMATCCFNLHLDIYNLLK